MSLDYGSRISSQNCFAQQSKTFGKWKMAGWGGGVALGDLNISNGV